MKKTSVYITVPNGSAHIHKSVAVVLMKLLQDPRYTIRVDLPTHSPYVNNLHHCMNDFLDIGREDYWLSMDDDNPPTNNPLDLVEFDCDLVGLPTPVWHNDTKDKKEGEPPFYWNALDAVGEDGWRPHQPPTGLQEVDAIGSGCFLVARRVMEKLRLDQPFSRTWKEDGTVLYGGDFSFCKRVKKAGYRIFAHYDYPCDHYNELPLMEVIKAFADKR